MSFLETGKKTGAVRAAKIAIVLDALRFRKMLEAARDLFALVADGREKMGGDYILDNHYVESLADRMIEKAGAVVFDAALLAPDGAGCLFERFDACRSRMRGLFLPDREAKARPEDGRGAELEPEYRRLQDLLDLSAGPGAESGESLTALIGGAVDHAASHGKALPLDELECEQAAGPAGAGTDMISLVRVNAESAPRAASAEQPAAAGERALALLLQAPSRSQSRRGAAPLRQWLAVSSDRHLSLRRVGAGAPRLEAELGGGADAGSVILYLSAGSGIETRLPAGFLVERNAAGAMARLDAAAAEDLEECLVQLGRVLFS